MVFVQDSSALDEENVESIEFGGGIKMKIRSLCINFINKALSSSLSIDVGQV